MEQNKLLHPSIDVLRVDGADKEAMEFAMVILHELGWKIQQLSFECAVSDLKFLYENMPDKFLTACATGHAALHRILGRTVSEP